MNRLFFPNDNLMHEAAAALIVETALSSISERGRFALALSGGNTPRMTHELLGAEKRMDATAWSKTYIFWGDERMVPRDSEHSNYRMAAETLLEHIPIPRANIFPMPVDAAPEQAARQYADALISALGENPVLDLCFQGLGPDGHTASLFPGSPLLAETNKLVAYEPDPGLPPKAPRLTLTLPMISGSRLVLFLISGKEKKAIVDEIFTSPDTARKKYPAAMLGSANHLMWLVAE